MMTKTQKPIDKKPLGFLIFRYWNVFEICLLTLGILEFSYKPFYSIL